MHELLLLHALYGNHLLKTLTENQVEEELIRKEKAMLSVLSNKQPGNFLKIIAGHF